MKAIVEVFKHSLMITGFVFVMMLIIDYINVQTKGIWNENLNKTLWKQYLLSGVLGIIPGCLGAFTTVTLYSHKILSLGALVTTMIATSGDEAFIMLAMMPRRAVLLTIIIFVIGIIAGFLVDKFIRIVPNNKISDNSLPLHQEDTCFCFPKGGFFSNFDKDSMPRILTLVIISIFLLGTASGELGPKEWNWIRITIMLTSFISALIVITVPKHFLEDHLWDHIVKVHIPRIFLWTFGTLLVVHFLLEIFNINDWIAGNKILILIVAVLIGLIPESGPHMVFITLFVSGTIPFSILLASSVVQDGHGMLPLLAESKRDFLIVKGINVVFGLIVGITGLLAGF